MKTKDMEHCLLVQVLVGLEATGMKWSLIPNNIQISMQQLIQLYQMMHRFMMLQIDLMMKKMSLPRLNPYFKEVLLKNSIFKVKKWIHTPNHCQVQVDFQENHFQCKRQGLELHLGTV